MALEVIGVLWLALIISVDVTGWAMAPGCSSMVLASASRLPVGGVIPVGGADRRVWAGLCRAVDVTTGWRGHRHRAAGAVLITGFGGIKGDLTDLGFPKGGRPGHDLRSAECWHGRGGAASATRRGCLVQKGASEGFATAVRGVGFVAAGLISLGLLAAFFLPRNAARTEAAGYVGSGRQCRCREILGD